MIPALFMQRLLNDFQIEISTLLYKSEIEDEERTDRTNVFFSTFLDLLCEAEDDLGFIYKMVERDPDCAYQDQNKRLMALLDYVKIAQAIYEPKKVN